MVTLTKAQRKAAAAAAKLAAATPTPPLAPATAIVVPTAPATVPATTNPQLAQAYQLGKANNVRPNTAADNAATWALLTAHLAANGGTATRASLQAVAATRNHVSYIGYAIRRQWLVPVPSTTPAATQVQASA